MKMAIITAHAGADCLAEAYASWTGQPLVESSNGWQYHDTFPCFMARGDSGMLSAYQAGFHECADYDILAYLHDDVLFREPAGAVWRRVLREFEDESVGLVGLGGALQHGSVDLYRAPYGLHQLGRTDYRSNVDDAETHGKRFTGECDVAVLDGFALIVRRNILERIGGWPLNTVISYVGYDYWLCCEARRQGYRVRLIGARCHHLGGRTVVVLKKGGSTPHQYEDAHKYIWSEFSDVLPFRAKETQ